MKCCAKTARPDNLRVGTFVMLAVLLLANRSSSQGSQPQETPSPETTIRSQANLVLVPALVKDPSGGIVYGLHADDFIIEDDGITQPGRLDETPEGQPVSLVVAVQRGRRAYAEFPRMQGLKAMLDPLFSLGTSRVALVEFDSEVKLARDFTPDESLISDDLTNLQPGDGGAAILDAIAYSINLLKNEPQDRLRVLLLISETRDHGSKAKTEDAVALIGRANALMYALAFSPALSNILDTGRGTNKNEMHEGVNVLDLGYRVAQAMRKNIPNTVATMTGGEYELFVTRKKFDLRMNDFTNHLHNRYLLSFAPKNPRPGLHQLRVRLKDGDNTVLARSSYWAEEAK
jgi:VWFA-related protein